MPTTTTTKPRGKGGKDAYTVVATPGTVGYLAPRDPACPTSQRYMAVHRVVDGGWGIVDRRTGRLLVEERKHQHRYAAWHDVQAAVATLNAPGR